jgi:hypothetical protein
LLQYLEREAIPEWRDKYVHYKALKGLLKDIERYVFSCAMAQRSEG